MWQKVLNQFSSLSLSLDENQGLKRFTEFLMFYLSLLAFVVLMIDWGFNNDHVLDRFIYWFYWFFNVLLILGFGLRIFFFRQKKIRKRRRFSQYLLLSLSFLVFCTELIAPTWLASATGEVSKHLVVDVIILFLFIEEVSERLFTANIFTVHPALIFAGSFLFLMFFGAVLLMLPKATTENIRFIDALFTATSAVSVTGLVVVDTGSAFTIMGQIIILVLIQLGGLGMLTFTNLFGFLFRGGTSFQNQLFIKDTLNAQHINDAFKNLIKIVLFTFVIEITGVFFIFLSLDHTRFETWEAGLFFAVFHAISAFCHAGFSTFGDSLYDENLRHNYTLHFIIAILILAGGIGYSIMINYYFYTKDYIGFLIKKYVLKREGQRRAYRSLVTINTRIAVWTSAVLLFFGFLAFSFFEWNAAFKEMSFVSKLSNAFFCSVTPRSGGFNTINMDNLGTASVMVCLMLMWIGASPGSTGGGIKTTTFAVALLNVWQQVQSKPKLEIFWREVPSKSIQRAFAIIVISLVLMFTNLILLTHFEPDLPFKSILFECFSACNTVGLSLGITSDLSDASRIVLIISMFLGRVGTFTLVLGLVSTLQKPVYAPHQYPKEDVFM